MDSFGIFEMDDDYMMCELKNSIGAMHQNHQEIEVIDVKNGVQVEINLSVSVEEQNKLFNSVWKDDDIHTSNTIPVKKNEYEVQKFATRLRKNRESAQKSRERVKENLLLLVSKNENLTKMNNEYKLENQRLLNIISDLQDIKSK